MPYAEEKIDNIQNNFFQKYSKTAELHTVAIIILTIILLQVDTQIKYNLTYIILLTVSSTLFTLIWHHWLNKKVPNKYINLVELIFHIVAINTLIALTGGALSIFIFYAILPVYRVIGIYKFRDNLLIIAIIEALLLIFLLNHLDPLTAARILPLMMCIVILDSAMISEAHILIDVESSYAKEQAKTEQLKEVNKYKDEFIYLASHELRSPLTVTKGYLDLLMHEKTSRFSEKGKDIMKHLVVSVDNLNRIIEDLLNISRMERGKATLKMSNVNIKICVDSIMEQIAINAKPQNIELIYKSELTGKEQIYTDETRFREIITNLLDNAIKYNKKNGNVHFNINIDKESLEINIKDNGIGIPEEEKSKISQKFFRASNATSATSQGTGLGLYAVYKIVDMLQGKLISQVKSVKVLLLK